MCTVPPQYVEYTFAAMSLQVAGVARQHMVAIRCAVTVLTVSRQKGERPSALFAQGRAVGAMARLNLSLEDQESV